MGDILKKYFFAFIKAIFWFLIFNVFQITGFCVLFIKDLLINKNNFKNMDTIVKDISSYVSNNVINILFISYILFFVFFAVYKLIKKKSFTALYKLNINKLNKSSCFMFFILGAFLNIFLSIILSFLKVNSDSSLDLSEIIKNGNQLIVFISIVVLAPIIEETIFRNFIFNCFLFDNSNLIIGIIVQALFFGFAHGNVLQFCYTSLLAIFFMYIDIKYKSIIPSMLMHMGLNCFAFCSLKDMTLTCIITTVLFFCIIPFLIKMTTFLIKNKNLQFSEW